jgi:TnpA family transposase
VARRQQLTEVQISELFDPPSDQRELVRHYTLSDTDLAAIRRCRGDHNRLGHALMLCYLRYPGRPLRAGERPPGPLLAFIADQIGVLPESVDEYLIAEPEPQMSCRRVAGQTAASSVRDPSRRRADGMAAAASH